MSEVDAEGGVGEGDHHPAQRHAALDPAHPGGEEGPGDGEAVDDHHRLEDPARVDGGLAEGEALEQEDANRGHNADRCGAEDEAPVCERPGGDPVEVPAGDAAGDHVEQVAGEHRVGSVADVRAFPGPLRGTE